MIAVGRRYTFLPEGGSVSISFLDIGLNANHGEVADRRYLISFSVCLLSAQIGAALSQRFGHLLDQELRAARYRCCC